MWIFKQGTGQIRDESMKLIATGYAGRGIGKNNPKMENEKGIGPLPRGTYHAVKLFDVHPTVGKYAIQLQPDDATRAVIVAYGRDPDSFFMHGDSNEHPGLASHGCIVAPRDVRERFWNSYDKSITVVE